MGGKESNKTANSSHGKTKAVAFTLTAFILLRSF
jgi:hypothetical protein